MKNRIERIVPGKEMPFTDISGAVRFGTDKVAEAAGAGKEEKGQRRGFEEDIPVTITKGDTSITLTMSEYEDFRKKVEEQLSALRGGICFTDLAVHGTAGTEYGRSGDEGAVGMAAYTDMAEEPDTVPAAQPGPEPEEIDEEDIETEKAPEEKRQENTLSEAAKAEAGRRMSAPDRKEKAAPAQGKGTPARGQSSRPAQAGRGVTQASRTPVRRTVREGAQRAAEADSRKKARTRSTVRTRRKAVKARGAEENRRIKASPPQEKGFRRSSLDEVELRANASQEAEQLMAKAARITQVSGRETSFSGRNGETLVFRNVYDREQGRDVTKGYIGGKEVSARQASDFIKEVTSKMSARQKDILTAAVDITLAQPDIRNKALENNLQRRAGTPERGNIRG